VNKRSINKLHRSVAAAAAAAGGYALANACPWSGDGERLGPEPLLCGDDALLSGAG